MKSPREDLLHCRYCRADNPADASRCWLCDADDWKPAGAGSLKKSRVPSARVRPAAANGGGSVLGVIFTAVAMLGVSALIGLGLGPSQPGLASFMMLAWWLALGVALSHRGGRHRAGNAFLAIVSAIGMVIAGLVVLGVSMAVLFLAVCFGARFR